MSSNSWEAGSDGGGLNVSLSHFMTGFNSRWCYCGRVWLCYLNAVQWKTGNALFIHVRRTCTGQAAQHRPAANCSRSFLMKSRMWRTRRYQAVRFSIIKASVKMTPPRMKITRSNEKLHKYQPLQTSIDWGFSLQCRIHVKLLITLSRLPGAWVLACCTFPVLATLPRVRVLAAFFYSWSGVQRCIRQTSCGKFNCADMHTMFVSEVIGGRLIAWQTD